MERLLNMTKNNYDYEAAKLLIDDETNVTETNPLKDLFQSHLFRHQLEVLQLHNHNYFLSYSTAVP